MGDPAYEARRAAEAARREEDRREAEEYRKRKGLGDELAMLSMVCVKDFLEGNACLIVEPIDNTVPGRVTVRFQRDPR